MRGKLMTAAIAVVLVCSLASCKNSTAARFDPVRYDESTQSAIERNGVYDGVNALDRDGRKQPNWNELFDNVNNNVVNREAMPETWERS